MRKTNVERSWKTTNVRMHLAKMYKKVKVWIWMQMLQKLHIKW